MNHAQDLDLSFEIVVRDDVGKRVMTSSRVPSTSAVDTLEKLQGYRAIQSLRYYLMVDSGRVAAAYSVRGADGQWLEANLDPGEQLDIECGALRASLNLTDLYEETGLTVA